MIHPITGHRWIRPRLQGSSLIRLTVQDRPLAGTYLDEANHEAAKAVTVFFADGSRRGTVYLNRQARLGANYVAEDAAGIVTSTSSNEVLAVSS